jgi:hypothetical protein
MGWSWIILILIIGLLAVAGIFIMRDETQNKMIQKQELQGMLEETGLPSFRSGTASYTADTPASVTFTDAMPNTNYAILFSGQQDDDSPFAIEWLDKTTAGFSIQVEDDDGANESAGVEWIAIPFGEWTFGDLIVKCNSGAGVSGTDINYTDAFPDENYAVVASTPYDADSPRVNYVLSNSPSGWVARIEDDGDNLEETSSIDWCAISYGTAAVGDFVIKAGDDTTPTTTPKNISLGSSFPDGNYVVATMAQMTTADNPCSPEVTQKQTNSFNVTAEDDDAVNNCNGREFRWIAITTGEYESGGDTVYPQFSDYWDNNATQIDTGTAYLNVSVIDTNGTVILQFDGTNYSASNSSGNATRFNVTIESLSEGTYPYNWTSYGNGTSSNYGVSNHRYYTVNVSTDTTPPDINFTLPTPSDGSTQAGNSIFVNVSSDDAENNISVLIDFDSSLIAWWRMDDLNDSDDVADYFGRYNGTVLGGNQFISGKMRNAIEFYGYNGMIDFGDKDELQGENYTYAFWVYDKPGASRTSYEGIISKLTTGTEPYTGIDIMKLGRNLTLFIESATVTLRADNFFDLEEWVQGAVVFDDGEVKVYKNGMLNSSGVYSGINATDSNFYLGRQFVDSTRYFNGSLDDVMVFNRSLNEAEVLALYSNTSAKYLEVNFTGLNERSYSFKAYSQDALGNVNSTETREVTITAEQPAQCEPVLNEDWVITDTQVCDGVEVTTGTGACSVGAAGALYLIGGANVTCNGLDASASGNHVFVSKNSRLMIT